MTKTALVLEGGGMRGVYTTGVLDCFLDEKISFPYIIGVSAGACHATSYLSGQRGRSFRVNTAYLKGGRYVGVKNLFRYGSMFNMDFIFDEIPNRLDPFDYDAFAKADCTFLSVATDCFTGKPVYLPHNRTREDNDVIRASSSLPLVSHIVRYKGLELLDGGIADSIPVRRAAEDGFTRQVVVLTRDRSYRKGPEGSLLPYKLLYRRYPRLVEAVKNRPANYNQSLDFLSREESAGNAFVLAPQRPVELSRFERDEDKLKALVSAGLRRRQGSDGRAAEIFGGRTVAPRGRTGGLLPQRKRAVWQKSLLCEWRFPAVQD